MTTEKDRQPTHRPALIAGEKATTAVPMPDGKSWAIVDTEDYERIVDELGYPGAWYAASNGSSGRAYVRVRVPGSGRCVGVARLVTGALAGERVMVRNGNPLDMRRKNLVRVTKRQLRQVWELAGHMARKAYTSPLRVDLG